MLELFQKFFLAVLIFAMAGCGETATPENISPVENTQPATENNSAAEKPATPENISPPVPNTENKPVVISFAGDCTLGSFKGAEDDFEYYWQYGAGYYFSNVKKIFAEDDITFVNLEGPLTLNPQTSEKQFPMRGDPKYVEILKAGSVEICNLSNNHIYDCDDAGFYDTVKILQDNDIKFCGEGYTSIIDVRGVKIGFLGFLGWDNSPYIQDAVSAAISEIRPNVDVVIVEFHWGNEREYIANAEEVGLAHFTIDSGADIVVGAHPHVIQGIELYGGKIIAYSLANFCFGANINPVDKDTFILQTSILKQGKNILIVPNVIPCKVSSADSYNDFCPTPATGSEATRILNKIADCSKNYPQTITF